MTVAVHSRRIALNPSCRICQAGRTKIVIFGGTRPVSPAIPMHFVVVTTHRATVAGNVAAADDTSRRATRYTRVRIHIPARNRAAGNDNVVAADRAARNRASFDNQRRRFRTTLGMRPAANRFVRAEIIPDVTVNLRIGFGGRGACGAAAAAGAVFSTAGARIRRRGCYDLVTIPIRCLRVSRCT